MAETNKPREVVHQVIKGLGGVDKCTTVGQMVRNRQQVKDLTRNRPTPNSNQVKNITGQSKRVNDPWYQLLIDSKRQARDGELAFVRDVRVAPDPLCVLTNRQQLRDVTRFCCDPLEFQPFTIDPTFDIGEFSVTVSTYQHLLLENKSDSKMPSFIGPVMIHHKKTKNTYSSFCGVIKALAPSLQDLLVFGTDDETALEQAFNENFERAIHLLCQIHIKKNIDRKLEDIGIRGHDKEQILYDIFGRNADGVFEKGLSDAENEESFLQQLEIFGSKWISMHENGKVFLKWFNEHKRQKFLKSVIASVRERSGLGKPPVKFTTNRCERSNGLIQDFLMRKQGSTGKCDEHSFAIALQELIEMQQREAELAIIGKGEYRLRKKFDHLFVSANDWDKMREDQRKLALQKIHVNEIKDCQSTAVTEATSKLVHETTPLLTDFQQAGIDWIPRDHLVRIITKAVDTINQPEKVVTMDSDTYLIPSLSKPRNPHVVNTFPNGKVACKDCPGFASCSVCAHAVAVCQKTGKL